MFLCYLCWEKGNIKHLAENSSQRNLGVPGGPSDKSPVSIWTFQGLSKANWKVKPWENFLHLLQSSSGVSRSADICLSLVANLNFEMRPDPQSLRDRNKTFRKTDLIQESFPGGFKYITKFKMCLFEISIHLTVCCLRFSDQLLLLMLP